LVTPDDKADGDRIYAIMKNLILRPLNTNAVYEPIPAASEMVNPLNTNKSLLNLDFYQLLNDALTQNPAVEKEKALVGKFKRLNIGAGKTFDPTTLSSSQIRGMKAGQKAAFRKLYDELKFGGKKQGGFNFRYNLGHYEDNTPLSAAVAFYGYGANTAKEALYVTALVDSDDNELKGGNKYQIHFNANQLPPVNAFWSITMYNRPDNQLIENTINRYNIGGLTPGIKLNPDGSLDIFIQNKQPDDTSNWLPAPEGAFWIILRMYGPKQEVLDGKYFPPEVTLVKST